MGSRLIPTAPDVVILGRSSRNWLGHPKGSFEMERNTRAALTRASYQLAILWMSWSRGNVLCGRTICKGNVLTMTIPAADRWRHFPSKKIHTRHPQTGGMALSQAQRKVKRKQSKSLLFNGMTRACTCIPKQTVLSVRNNPLDFIDIMRVLY